MELLMTTRPLDVAIVGAGPAGLGVGVVLKSMGVDRLAVLDREGVGASFDRWPEEMRLITPSFTSNAWGPVDLNAITPTTSPAFTLGTEHPTGAQYAEYLRGIAEHFAVPVRSGLDVLGVTPEDGGFTVTTDRGPVRARAVVWAVGEFASPRRSPFPSADLALHTSQIDAYAKLDSDRQVAAISERRQEARHVVIGGYESGVDAAVHLAAAGRRVILLDRTGRWEDVASDPSLVLSPFTHDRLTAAMDSGRIELVGDADVMAIARAGDGYEVLADDGRRWTSDGRPVLATGFGSGLGRVRELFDRDEDGTLLLDDADASTLVPGLHLVGPEVTHEGLVFCFIYKFRQRFAVVAKAIGERLGVDTEPPEAYRTAGMYLEDLSCCHAECAC
jgi:putative flavoprotein involved in K+ transport